MVLLHYGDHFTGEELNVDFKSELITRKHNHLVVWHMLRLDQIRNESRSTTSFTPLTFVSLSMRRMFYNHWSKIKLEFMIYII